MPSVVLAISIGAFHDVAVAVAVGHLATSIPAALHRSGSSIGRYKLLNPPSSLLLSSTSFDTVLAA